MPRSLADHEIPLMAPRPIEARSRFAVPPAVTGAEAPYRWDLDTDRLTWGDGASERLLSWSLPLAASGQDYARLVGEAPGGTRYDAVNAPTARDTGAGVDFLLTYALGAAPPGAAPQPGEAPRTLHWVEDRGRWFAGPDGRPTHVEGTIRLCPEPTRRDAGAIRFGRAAVIAALESERRAAPSVEPGTAVLLLALADLALMRDTYGHAVVETMVEAAADHLLAAVRRVDTVIRWPEDGCAVVLRACGLRQASVVGNRLLERFDALTVETAAGRFEARVLIGAAALLEPDGDGATVLQQAEDALHRAGRDRGTRLVTHAAGTSREADRRHAQATTQTILTSLESDVGVSLAFQPVVAARTREVAFHEALIRLSGPDGQIVQPSAVLPVAESSGLVRRLDRRALELAFAHLGDHPGRTLSVNVSPLSAHDPTWAEAARDLARQNPDRTRRLIVEITESAAIGDLDATERLIGSLKGEGYRVAMDDFGAGHTSFRSLRRLKFDLLKLDGAFVQNLPQSPDDACFVRALLDLAGHLGIPTVAEWVEDEESAALLADWGATYFQGHLFGRAE